MQISILVKIVIFYCTLRNEICWVIHLYIDHLPATNAGEMEFKMREEKNGGTHGNIFVIVCVLLN